ncbi:hypothetical protein BD560DRAFT_421146 [Blakeslea trispora]|nr:hypothetical protein BD560DRAFT_421146 [Blakeslea trispora]
MLLQYNSKFNAFCRSNFEQIDACFAVKIENANMTFKSKRSITYRDQDMYLLLLISLFLNTNIVLFLIELLVCKITHQLDAFKKLFTFDLSAKIDTYASSAFVLI